MSNFDPTSLSDDEIREKISKSYKYLSFQSSMGHGDVADTIRNLITTLEYELNERQIVTKQKREIAQQKANKINELDPISLGEIEGEGSRKPKPLKQVQRPITKHRTRMFTEEAEKEDEE